MKRTRRVKIVATLGPATDSVDMIKSLFDAGADVFRINMSHSSHEDMRELQRRIRQVEAEVDRPIGILCDLQGPKLRIGDMEKKTKIKKGDMFRFDLDETPGDKTRVFLPHKEIIESVTVGDKLILDDGKLSMVVIEHGVDYINATVLVGGKLSKRKGISLPDTLLPFSAMTDKDRADLEFAIGVGVDWIALSFVQRVSDVIEARQLADGKAAIMAKIEKPSAISDLDGIIEESDGLMIARGDLGVEMPLEQVPGLQKRILRSARQAGKPVVVATQMLESMIENSQPTRAEASDVANAILDGTDGVMLSGETAVGKYPAQAIAVMARIARQAETAIASRPPDMDISAVGESVAHAACRAAEEQKARAIVTFTQSGTTALLVSKHRPAVPIVAATPSETISRRISLYWGVTPIILQTEKTTDNMIASVERAMLRKKLVKARDLIVITAGVPIGVAGSTNMMNIHRVGE
ncbi:MAG TPA: pyruvate kinase [Nitrospiraceae bacterium]|nr:pyruvate kinase [Nitrospiraceae bacterium]